ncbi:hypothetical protein F8568_029890 [Actinomadura sp. LD22]|uniref:Uncharacterized protein n=1 Tax=Actinomadura physcomitrii TaxID=2650748 RepID=A0A6I4MKN1_9ACTN|nr:hypothetical protein [Actinomadura physcomitrii]MWA04517.1 hypothetical protein [Actinomadura physcomitrii]
MAYRIRFVPVLPVLMIIAGVVAAPLVVAGMFMAEMHAWQAVLGILFWVVVVLWLVGGGVARLRRMARSGWTALAVEPEGVRIGARPGAGPQFFPWSDVDAIVCFDVPRIVRRAPIRHLGVSLRDGAPGGVAEFEERLAAARAGSGASGTDRETFDHMARKLADGAFPREHAVSAYVRRRDWWLNRNALERALENLAPGVPLVDLEADRPPHEWLDDRARLAALEVDRPRGVRSE